MIYKFHSIFKHFVEIYMLNRFEKKNFNFEQTNFRVKFLQIYR